MLITNIKDYSLTKIIKAIIRRILNIPHVITWMMPFRFTNENKQKIKMIKDIHKGERCFIIANGPSLKKTDLSLLKNEYTIGMNRIYLLKDKVGFKPTYLVVSDIETQLSQFQKEYDNVSYIKFFPWKVRKVFSYSDNLIYYKIKFSNSFSKKFEEFVSGGKSVTAVCLQLAYYMGFSEVILIGKDHSYNHKQKGVPGTRVKSTGFESNHFISGYYKKGMTWTLPNYFEEEIAYRNAQEVYEKNGRKIYDATIGGKLNVFPKIDYYKLFNRVY